MFEEGLHEVLIHSQYITYSKLQSACRSFAETHSSSTEAKQCTAIEGALASFILA